MKKNVFDSIINFFNQNNTEINTAGNIPENNLNNENFDDNSYIDDVLNSDELLALSINTSAQVCKSQMGM